MLTATLPASTAKPDIRDILARVARNEITLQEAEELVRARDARDVATARRADDEAIHDRRYRAARTRLTSRV